jgi:hypothetical protein
VENAGRAHRRLLPPVGGRGGHTWQLGDLIGVLGWRRSLDLRPGAALDEPEGGLGDQVGRLWAGAGRDAETGGGASARSGSRRSG